MLSARLIFILINYSLRQAYLEWLDKMAKRLPEMFQVSGSLSVLQGKRLLLFFRLPETTDFIVD